MEGQIVDCMAMTIQPRWLVLGVLLAASAQPTRAQQPVTLVKIKGDSITIRMADVDIRAALQALSKYFDKPLSFSSLPPTRISLETPSPIARSAVLPLVRGVLEPQNLEIVMDTAAGIYKVRAKAVATTTFATSGVRSATPPLAQQNALVELFVIRLKHARASDVAAGVNALYGRASAMGELGDNRARPTLDQSLRPQPPVLPPGPATAAQSAAPNATAGVANTASNAGSGRGVFQSEVTIVPDARTNALLVRATQSDFDLVNSAVKELDVRPLQVLIEVLVAEVSRDRSLSFGVDASIPQTNLPGKSGGSVGASSAGLDAGNFVVSLLKLTAGTTEISATLRAAAAKGDVQIVSRPVLIAANNELAEILVGSQRPFVEVQRTLPTDGGARDQVVQYKDVGTRLSVRPTISADGYVMIAVTQEINAATTETAFDAPVISTRSLQTQLLIKDQQTVVLGGLIDRQRDRNQTGIPFLSALPLIGGLFGSSSHRSTETELFIFLTPRIIKDDADADAVTAPLRERANVKEPPR